jgi:hypothetical protein
MGPLCGLALYLATLQYATARLLVLILLAMIPAVLVVEWRRFNVKRAIGFAVILLWVVGVWKFEKHHGAERAYVHARGEQYFTFLKEPGYFRDFTGRTHDPNRITLQDRFDLLKGVLKRTVPQFRWFVSPQTDLRTNSILEGDPPRIPLYSAALFPFLLWGLGYSLFRLRSWRYSLPVVWVALATGPLLLTNRVDAHRIMVFVIPFTLWIAFGVGDAAQIVKRGKTLRWLQHTFAIFLALILLWKNSVLLFWESPPISRTCEVLTEEIQKIEGPLRVGVRGDHREISLVNLALLERTRRNPENTGLMIPLELTDRLGDDNAPDRRQADGGMNWMTSFLQEATVIMAPSTQFRSLSDALAAAGYKVISFTKKGYPFFVVQQDRRDADKAISGLLTDTEEGKLSSLEVWKGKKIWLDELQAKDIQYGFQAPVNNRSWDETPIRMDDVIYGHGIGMHAWCKSTYDVPEKAVAFQALAGFSDAVRDRTTTEMTFEIWDEQNRRLYYSGFVTPAKGPRQVFVELKDSKQITLVVTEGRDGRDCDHANWAEAAFLLPPE